MKPPRFPCVPFDTVSVKTDRNYLVKGIIPRRGLVVIYGPPKCGKSFWTFDLVMHIALGWEYRGKRVQQGPIVYLVMEGADGFRNRVEAFRQGRMDSIEGETQAHLIFVSVNLIRDHRDLIANIGAQLGDHPPAAVVVDTLNRTLVGSESKDEDMAAYLQAAGAIEAAFEAAVLVIHHSGLEGGRPRGHTSLTGAADAQLSVVRDAADNIIVTVERAKDSAEGEIIASSLRKVEIGVDVDGDAITSLVVEPVEGVVAKAKAQGPKLPKGARIALDALHNALGECGEVPPTSNHMPAGVQAVKLDTWRDYAERGGLSASEKESARRMAFVRASEALVAAHAVGIWRPWVWAARAQ